MNVPNMLNLKEAKGVVIERVDPIQPIQNAVAVSSLKITRPRFDQYTGEAIEPEIIIVYRANLEAERAMIVNSINQQQLRVDAIDSLLAEFDK